MLELVCITNSLSFSSPFAQVQALKDFFNMLSNFVLRLGIYISQGIFTKLEKWRKSQATKCNCAAMQDPTRACYGPKHVEVAHERMAVQTLLITDDLFRNADVAARKKYVNLVNSVKKSGGTAHVFSSMHVSGEQLGQLTGVAAILRFPLPDLDDIEM
ncbi:hypothetical protein EZV62_024496 [Acer yangbiense]|uniref:eRF1 domain-containing protein n=1 Tax=Acer yangbiense TaxID=1000413 RepID=A0A5C7GVG5_9ROSI|nr:hypothetical protein EZV62_024496 [Acer yangbiense]